MHGTTNEGFTINHMNEIEDEDVRRRAHGRPRHADVVQPLRRSAGRTRWTRRTSGPSRSPRTGAARATARSSAGPTASRRAARSATSSPTSSTSPRRSSRRPGIPEPTTVHGVTQRPYEGTAMNYCFDDADAAERHEHPVLRDARQPGDLPQGLDRGRQAQGPLAGVRPRPRRRRVGALQRRGGLDPVERPRRARSPRSWPSCSGCSSSRRPGSTCCRSTSARPSGSTPTSPAGPLLITGDVADVLPGHEAAERELHDQHQEQVATRSPPTSRCPTAASTASSSPRAAPTAGGAFYATDGTLALRLQPARHRDRHRRLRRAAAGRASRRCGSHFAYDGGGVGKGGTVTLFAGDDADRRGPRRADDPVPVLVRRDRRRRAATSPRRSRPTTARPGNEFTGDDRLGPHRPRRRRPLPPDRRRAPAPGRDDAPVSVSD